MSESNRNKNLDRWQELAEQLGLAGEPRQEPAAREELPAPGPAERPAPRPPKEVPYEETDESFALTPAPAEREKVESRQSRLEVPSETDFEPEDAQVEVLADTALIQSESTPDSPIDLEVEGALAEGEASSTRTAGRRRRRRRSSGKNKKPAAGEAPATEGSPEPQETAEAIPDSLTFTPPADQPAEPAREESTGDEGGDQRGRNRGRGGRGRRPEEAEVAVEPPVDEDEVQESGGAVGFEEESDDEEVANYANWSVPSWKDLIASLYRPDR